MFLLPITVSVIIYFCCFFFARSKSTTKLWCLDIERIAARAILSDLKHWKHKLVIHATHCFKSINIELTNSRVTSEKANVIAKTIIEQEQTVWDDSPVRFSWRWKGWCLKWNLRYRVSVVGLPDPFLHCVRAINPVVHTAKVCLNSRSFFNAGNGS